MALEAYKFKDFSTGRNVLPRRGIEIIIAYPEN